MQNYRVYFENGEEEEILQILRDMEGVAITSINDRSIGITINADNPRSKYLKLLDEIDKRVYIFRQFYRYTGN